MSWAQLTVAITLQLLNLLCTNCQTNYDIDEEYDYDQDAEDISVAHRVVKPVSDEEMKKQIGPEIEQKIEACFNDEMFYCIVDPPDCFGKEEDTHKLESFKDHNPITRTKISFPRLTLDSKLEHGLQKEQHLDCTMKNILSTTNSRFKTGRLLIFQNF